MHLSFFRAGMLAGASLFALPTNFALAGDAHHTIQSPQAKPHGHPWNIHRELTVLYDQTSNASGFGTISQDFSDDEAYSSAAADDFVVPSGKTWKLKEVDIPGTYFNGSGPANSEDVTILQDKKGKLGKVIAQFTNVVGTDNNGSFAIPLGKKGVKLKSGHYWLSVVINMPFLNYGEWFWENQTAGTTEGDPAMWENPGDGYGSGCTTWTPETKCVLSPLGDQMFVLKGTAR